jgi:hypothetical protein
LDMFNKQEVEMKRVLLLVAVASMVGCASNPQTAIKQTQAPVKAENKYEQAAPAPTALKVPDWFIQPPENTDRSIFTVGTATSTDLGMAVQKAQLDANAKLSFQIKSYVEAMAKSFKADSTNSGAESSELLVRNLTRTTITGQHKVDSQITQEGRAFRVFVLMRYPLGDANKLLAEATEAKSRRAMAAGSRNAMKEMQEGLDKAERREYEQDNNIAPAAPQSKVEPVTVDPPKPAVSGTNSVTTKEGKTVELLDVDNAEYKQRRAEALAKPNAVIGQTVLR